MKKGQTPNEILKWIVIVIVAYILIMVLKEVIQSFS